VDKAMEWKEKTMKAKWLWVTWAHIALVLIITVEYLFVLGAVTFVLPKFDYFRELGWLHANSPESTPVEALAFEFFAALGEFCRSWVWWVAPLAILWILFEWRVRSENKSMIRLALMGTAAFKLLIAVVLTAYFTIMPLTDGMFSMHRRDPQPEVKDAIAKLQTAMPVLENALTARDWNAVQSSLSKARGPLSDLVGMGASAPVLVSMEQQQKVDELRGRLVDAFRAVYDAQRGAPIHDATSVEQAIAKIHAVLNQLPPTTRPGN
jgi:hypothetical protein